MKESAKKPAHDLDRDLVLYPSTYTRQKADAELAQMWLAERRLRGCRKVHRRHCRNDAGECLLASLQTLLSKGRFQQWQCGRAMEGLAHIQSGDCFPSNITSFLDKLGRSDVVGTTSCIIGGSQPCQIHSNVWSNHFVWDGAAFVDVLKVVCESSLSSPGCQREKMHGNSLVWDHVGQLWDPCAEVQKILAAWHRPETLGASTLITSLRFPVEHFDVPPRVLQWKETQSVLLFTCPAGAHLLSASLIRCIKLLCIQVRGLWSMRPVSGQWAKAWCDVTHAHDVHNRCSDGHIPAKTPKIFTANDEVQQFWPPEYFHSSHQAAIDRRTVWVDCPHKLFKDREAKYIGNNVTLRSAIQGRCVAPQKVCNAGCQGDSLNLV